MLAIKLGTPVTTLADVIHPFPAFNRVLGETLGELAAKVERKRSRAPEDDEIRAMQKILRPPQVQTSGSTLS